MSDLLKTLRERGFVQKTTDDETDDKPLEKLLASKHVTGYIGFDPTASSFHIGNLVSIMVLSHLQRSGHRPLAIIGGGTGMVGDPSGKSELRKVLSPEVIQANLEAQRKQLSRYLDLGPAPEIGAHLIAAGADGTDARRGFLLNNADWLASLNYIEFLRDVGRHFSVNRMLAAESVKLRLESEAGLSFLEFNYSILQAYDFFVLNERYGCELQLGGGDQWGNIVAGTDLIRRMTGRRAHGVTTPLVTTSDGKKMGKTEKGAVWLDPTLTSPYDFYQYWVNIDDRDVGRFLRMFTLLPIEEIQALEALSGADIRRAKSRLAFEATALTHGEEEAKRAEEAAKSLFGGGGDGASVPTHSVGAADLSSGILAVQLFADAGLCESKSAAKRMARQGGLYVNGDAIAEDRTLIPGDLKDNAILLRAGKKKHVKVTVGTVPFAM